MKPIRYYLSIRTWEGIAPDAKHYYGRVDWRDGAGTRLEDDITTPSGRMGYLAEDTLRRAAMKWFKARDNKHPDDLFIVGSISTLDPREMLAGPAELKKKANVLWEQFEALNGWECRKDQEPDVKKVCDAWTALLSGVQK
jgi:hypothetical protein